MFLELKSVNSMGVFCSLELRSTIDPTIDGNRDPVASWIDKIWVSPILKCIYRFHPKTKPLPNSSKLQINALLPEAV